MHSRAFDGRPFIALTSEQTRYAMLMLAVICQLITIVITWPLWQARDHPVNLPLHGELPEFSFGWAMVASLVVAAARPKIWSRDPLDRADHGLCVSISFAWSPSSLGWQRLMLVYFGIGLRVCRWYLVAMWIWTGLHKFLSSEWLGHDSWTLVTQAGLPPEHLYLPVCGHRRHNRSHAGVAGLLSSSLGSGALCRGSSGHRCLHVAATLQG